MRVHEIIIIRIESSINNGDKAGGSLPYLSGKTSFIVRSTVYNQTAIAGLECKGGGGASFPNLNDSDLWEEAQKLKTRDYQPKVPPWLDVEYTTESTLSADTIRQQNPRLAALLDYGAKDRLPPGKYYFSTSGNNCNFMVQTDAFKQSRGVAIGPDNSNYSICDYLFSADSSVRERHEQKYEDAKIDIMKGFARLGKSHEEIMTKLLKHQDHKQQYRLTMQYLLYMIHHRASRSYRRDMGEYGKVETHAGFQVKDLSKMSLDERYLRAHRNVENEIRYCFDLTVSPDSQTVYLADSDNGTIKRIPHEGGKVELWTGNPVLYPIPEDGVGSAAQFKMPLGIHYGSGGYLYVADTGHSIIRKISPDRNVTSLGYFHNFDHPHGSYWLPFALFERFGYLFIADSNNVVIRKMQLSGDYEVTTVAGGKKYPAKEPEEGWECSLESRFHAASWRDGSSKTANFQHPIGLAVDSKGNIFVVDNPGIAKNCPQGVRKICPNGFVTSFAGFEEGFADGMGTEAKFHSPYGIDIDDRDTLYVTDSLNHAIRMISPDGNVTTIVGNGTCGDTDGSPLRANLDEPRGIAVAPDGCIYVSDAENTKIKKIKPYKVPRTPDPEEEFIRAPELEPESEPREVFEHFTCDWKKDQA
eukprot:jgi/Bigna1/85185/estExt_fgenesh1_pg.C_20389